MPIVYLLLGFAIVFGILRWTTEATPRAGALVFHAIVLAAFLLLALGFLLEVIMRGGGLPISG